MSWEMISTYILPPLIGAVIGYFTNMIAVKMLFFPREATYIFGWHVPLTPGAIPKGKARLARSAGQIVQNELFTKEDISGKLLTEEVEKPIIDRVMSILDENIKDTGAVMLGSSEKFDAFEKNFVDLLTLKIKDAIKRMDIPQTIKHEGIAMLNEQVMESTILSLVVSDRLIERIMNRVASSMEDFIEVKGTDMIHEITASRIHDLGERTPLYVLELAGYDRDTVRER